MPLQKQVIGLSAAGALDTKSDEKTIGLQGMIEAYNCEYEKTGAVRNPIEKSTFPNDDIDLDPIASDFSSYDGKVLIPSENSLAIGGCPGIHPNIVYSSATSEWNVISNSTMTTPFDSYQLDTRQLWMANHYWDYSETAGVEAWVVNNADDLPVNNAAIPDGLSVFTRDVNTGAIKQVVTFSGKNPKVHVWSTGVGTYNVFVSYYDSTPDLVMNVFNQDGTLIDSETFLTVFPALSNNSDYDYNIVYDSTYVILHAVSGSSATDLKRFIYTKSTGVFTSASYTLATSFSQLSTCTGFNAGAGNGIIFAYTNTPALDAVFSLLNYPTGGSSISNSVLTATAATKVTACYKSGSTYYAAYEDITGTPPVLTRTLYIYELDYVGGTQTLYADLENINISSQIALFQGTSVPCIMGTHGEDARRYDFFLVFNKDLNNTSAQIGPTDAYRPQVLARFNEGNGRGFTNAGLTVDNAGPREYSLTPLILAGGGQYLHHCSYHIERTISDERVSATGLVYQPGLKKFIFDLNPQAEKYVRTKLGTNTYISGGYVQEFDGSIIFENGFHWYPKILQVDQNGAGSVDIGFHSYKIVYEYTDNRGNISRSKSSDAVQYEVAASTKLIEIIFLNLTIGIKPNKTSNSTQQMRAIIYRTEAGGTVFYRVGSTNDLLFGSALVIFEDDSPDSAINANEVLYDEEALSNDAGPGCKYLYNSNGRIYGIDSNDPRNVFYSKPKFFGESVNFSNFLSFRVETERDLVDPSLVSIASVDDKTLFFKNGSISYTYGEPANEAGQNSTLVDPIEITSVIGCRDPGSMAVYPNGVLFMSEKGIYGVNRGLSLEYIGAPVEAFNSGTVLSNVVVRRRNEIKFLLDSTSLVDTGQNQLVYNYLLGKWSPYITDEDLFDATIFSSTAYYLNENGSGIQLFLDSITRETNKLRIQTPWIKAQDLQQFLRVSNISILGHVVDGTGQLLVNIYYDYQEAIESSDDQYQIDTLATDDPFQYQIKPARQKCQSFKLEVIDNTGSEDFELTGFAFLIGLKGTLNKIAEAKTY